MRKILVFFGKILEKSLRYSIHVSIIVLTFAVIFIDFLWATQPNSNIDTAWADASVSSYENIDSRKADELLAYIYELVPPLNTGEDYQSTSFLTEGESFLNKPNITNTIISGLPRDKVTTYTVSEGETYWTIAYKFEIDINTLKWANDIEDLEDIQPGQKLVILPVNGLLYTFEEGDNINNIASEYGISVQRIKEQNQLASLDFMVGQQVVLPGAKKYRTYVPSSNTSMMGNGAYDGRIMQGTGDFMWPVNSYPQYITQYFGWVTNWYKHTGIDLDSRNGLDILASDRGTVVSATYGWGGGYGNHVIIDHGNGYQTLYAHLAYIGVNVGDDMEKGQRVGTMGTTGNSTGVHLHFEIRQNGVALNPLAFVK